MKPMIAINYTEFKPNSYKSVVIYHEDKIKNTFASGDIVKDFEEAINSVQGTVLYSSSVDDFLNDDGGYYYDKNHMIKTR